MLREDSFVLVINAAETYVDLEIVEIIEVRPRAPTTVINEDGEEVDIAETLSVSAETVSLDLEGLRSWVEEQRGAGRYSRPSDSEEEERVVEVGASDTGELGVGFPAKVLVFGDGFLPGPESISIGFADPPSTAEDGEAQTERRRL